MWEIPPGYMARTGTPDVVSADGQHKRLSGGLLSLQSRDWLIYRRSHGAAVAHALAGDGWTVVLAGRRREALEAVVASGSGLTGVLDAIPTDVTDEASVRKLADPGQGQGECYPWHSRSAAPLAALYGNGGCPDC